MQVLKVEMRPSTTSTSLGQLERHYFIHYQGWKPKWDEWVNSSRIIKHTPQNQDYQTTMRRISEEMDALAQPLIPKKKKPTRKLRDVSPPPPLAKKPRGEELEETILDAPESLELPFLLQKILAEDYDLVNKQKYVCGAPPTPERLVTLL